MMTDARLKYIFYILSSLVFVLMLILSKNAGVSCDEVLHYNQSVSVYKYFTSHGKDQSALNTPVTNLKYYGQAYDNIVTFLTKWLNIKDIYSFRNIMSSIAGWLVFFITALFAVWLMDYRAGILVLILFLVSPTFFGHTQNNLKDIPFALGYISGTFFILKFLSSGKKIILTDLIFLVISIGCAISIRAGGLLLLCYLFFFFLLVCLIKYIRERKVDFFEGRVKFISICGVTILSWFSGILLWPYALQSPVANVIRSYRIMAHFPGTFRQIFEGRVEWSDFMPWYFIPKSMLITIPVIVLVGFLLFLFFIRKVNKDKILNYLLILFTVIFPLIFVIYQKSNVYSSWRQFLFLYPAIVLLASAGIYHLMRIAERAYLKYGIVFLIILLSFHPLRFMYRNPSFYYLYYNQLVGGLKGAYAKYETDYYYISQTAASQWLINHNKNKATDSVIKVKATYPVDWFFRDQPKIMTSYFRYDERSMLDWDYAIVANRYISPFKLRNNSWPPKNAIHIIYADSVPVGAVLERRSKDDYKGYQALSEGKNQEAIGFFEKALKADDRDEMIFYNFAAALYNTGQFQKADSALKMALKINPDFEPALMYLGNISKSQNRQEDAIGYYERVIKADRKYFEAYVELAEILISRDVGQSRELLKSCLDMNPKYIPAIKAMADTYRSTDPDVAGKYDELARSLN